MLSVPAVVSLTYGNLTTAGTEGAEDAQRTRLAALKFLTAKEVDGLFGAGTEAAVKKFQSSKKLKADGRVGSKTRLALMK